MGEIRLEHISKRYVLDAPGAHDEQGRWALEPLDLLIPDGELVVLVGPSGCGKSTTLRIIAGLEEPTTGEVSIDGRQVTSVPPASRDVAMVFQSYALYPHMTVYDNLAFSLRMHRVARPEIHRRVCAAAASLGIEDLLTRLPRQLSGGQRQRVAIGRAVVRDPKVFLFDEPLSNLDAQLRAEMRREIARIHQRAGATAVYVTHDQTEAMTLADRIVVLKDGKVQQVGRPLELYDAPANLFVAGFLGSPAMNFLRCAASHRLAKVADHREVVLGIRPQDLSLRPRGPDAETTPPLRARVEVRELMGSEAFLHLTSDVGPLVLRTEAHDAVAEGENVSVWVDPQKLHLFDPETERRL